MKQVIFYIHQFNEQLKIYISLTESRVWESTSMHDIGGLLKERRVVLRDIKMASENIKRSISKIDNHATFSEEDYKEFQKASERRSELVDISLEQDFSLFNLVRKMEKGEYADLSDKIDFKKIKDLFEDIDFRQEKIKKAS